MDLVAEISELCSKCKAIELNGLLTSPACGDVEKASWEHVPNPDWSSCYPAIRCVPDQPTKPGQCALCKVMRNEIYLHVKGRPLEEIWKISRCLYQILMMRHPPYSYEYIDPVEPSDMPRFRGSHCLSLSVS